MRKFKKAAAMFMSVVCMATAVLPGWQPHEVEAATTARQMEALSRGLVAVKTGSGVFLSWRLLGTESYSTTFNVYRNGTKIASNISNSTNYQDKSGSTGDTYYVRSVVNGVETTESDAVKPWSNNYKDVPLDKPSDFKMDDGSTATYAANDATVADVDGDGEYEIILKWDPSNSQDNSISGYTANVYVDCYELDGTKKWRIDLGKNIRAGAHYTQFIAYDLNGDGKAEVGMKTADGTITGDGKVIGDASKDYRNSSGYVLSGPEYYTLFEGKTGKELVTIDYVPQRGTVSKWGDSYGNRVDRFLAGVAYLDGKTPSLIICRGYYTRSVIVAYEYKGGNLTQEWCFDTNDSGNSAYASQGNHNLSVADVDNDGKDEIVYGSCVIDNDGTGLYSTGDGHGDALHVGDFDPDRSGLEIYQVHENKTSDIESIQYRDAKTGKTIWAKKLSKDIGRGLIINIDPDFYPFVTLASNGNYYDVDGNAVTSSISGLGINFAMYWDGDLYREGLDGTTIRKWDYNNDKVVTALTGSNVHSNNGTKSTPSLSGDIMGDWREEVIWPTSDDKALRIYTTTDVTDAKLYTLMHDSQYRCAIAWQNVGYNQPPHPSYYIGPTMATPAQPSMYTVGSYSLKGVTGGSTQDTTSATQATTQQQATTQAPQETTSSSGGSNVSGSAVVHNFKTDGTTSSLFTIEGNTSSSKGSVTYNGMTSDTCLKMESATNISFTAPSAGKLTLVFGGSTDASGKSVKIDGSSKTIGSDQTITVDVSAGSHTVTKGDSINLFFMVYTPESTGGSGETESTTSSAYTDANITAGYYYIKNANSGLYMDVAASSASDGANIQQWTFTGGNAQIFQLKSEGSGYYSILTATSGYASCIDVLNGAADNGTNIEQWPYWGGDMQKYRVIDAGNGKVAFLTVATDCTGALDVYDMSTADGGNVNQWEYWGGAGQQWILEAAPQYHTHSYTASVTTQATCTTAGVKTYTCSCGDSYTEAIAATGHSYTASVTKEATCGTAGVKTYTCSCGDSYTEVIPATGQHSYTGTVTTAAGCETTGVKTYRCTCGASYTEVIAATGHSYSNEWTIDKAATTTSTGEKSRHCTNCSARTDVTVIPKIETEEVKNGLVQENGKFYYYVDGAVATDYTGLVYSGSIWWYVESGVLNTGYTGTFANSGGTWYIINGQLDVNYTGIRYDGTDFWYVQAGKVNTSFVGLYNYADAWWYVKDGKIQADYKGMIDYSGYTWYVAAGKVDITFTGLGLHNGVWYCVQAGKVNLNYTGLVSNGGSWWYVQNGILDTTMTGIVETGGSQWLVATGKLQSAYTGSYTYNGNTYKIVNGKVQ